MKKEESQMQSHGITVEEMKKLKMDQVHGNEKFIVANNASERDIKDEFFKKEFQGYKISKANSHLYHLAMEARSFNSSTGEKISNPRVQTFSPDNFDRITKGRGFSGYTLHILHNPLAEKIKADQK